MKRTPVDLRELELDNPDCCQEAGYSAYLRMFYSWHCCRTPEKRENEQTRVDWQEAGYSAYLHMFYS